MRQASNGRRVADLCRVSGAPAFVSQMLRKGEAAVVQIKSDAPVAKPLMDQPRGNAFIVTLSLYDDVDRDAWIGQSSADEQAAILGLARLRLCPLQAQYAFDSVPLLPHLAG